MKGFWKYITLLTIGSIAFAALFFYLGYRAFHEKNTMDQEVVVFVTKGQPLIRTALDLEKQGLISSKDIFKLGVILYGFDRKLQAGEFAVPARSNMFDIMVILSSDKIIQHRVTIVEGWTSWQIVNYLNGIDNMTNPITELPIEGSILPETYLYTKNTNRYDLIDRMQDRQRTLLKYLWQKRDTGLPFSSAQEALILASIVEKETAVGNERPHIAGVFINRLRNNMRLQTDPTVIYGIDSKGFINRPIQQSDLKTRNPYNTYMIKGLPPTAIANPGRASLEAVLHPLKTDDLYFVANGTGGHVFARTLREHLKNVKNWRKIEKEN